MENLDKTIALLKKLKALADRGVDGEQENAETMLYRLLEKHGLSISDIEENVKRKCWYTIAFRHKRLFFQLHDIVVPDLQSNYWTKHNSKTKFALELTISEELELTSMFDFYAKNFDDQYYALVNNFIDAYIRKQDLFSRKDRPTSNGKFDLEALMLQQVLMDNIKTHKFAKRIGVDDFKS